jgi:hypothetical protein
MILDTISYWLKTAYNGVIGPIRINETDMKRQRDEYIRMAKEDPNKDNTP